MKNKKQKTMKMTHLVRSPAARVATVLVSMMLAAGMHDAALAQQATPPAPAAQVNDFPTLARVEYVFECLNDNAGQRHEMVYKCVCAVDRVAESVPYDRWVELSTFFKAQPIAGERGAYVRERSDIREQLKSYRDLQLKAKQACFIPTDQK